MKLQPLPKADVSLQAIEALIREDRRAVDREIDARLRSEIALINQLSSYIVHSGGKRLRPTLVLLAARACGYTGAAHCRLAAIIEFIHTATLLHDDVVDASELRRGQSTANAVWGNEASVLVGDFLYSRAFEMMVEVGNLRVMEILATTTNTIAEGEVMQLLNCNDPDVTEARYLQVIRSKTAQLFAAAAQVGGVISGQPPAIESGLAEYGMHLGTAFQLIDDVLDYRADSHTLGKNVGDDLAEGKPTLPLIHALRVGTETQRTLLRDAIAHGNRAEIDAVVRIIESTGSIAYTAARAADEAARAEQALTPLPPSPYKQALLDLAQFSVSRSY